MICSKLAHLLLYKTQTQIIDPPLDSFEPNMVVNAPFKGNDFQIIWFFYLFPTMVTINLQSFKKKCLNKFRENVLSHKYTIKKKKKKTQTNSS